MYSFVDSQFPEFVYYWIGKNLFKILLIHVLQKAFSLGSTKKLITQSHYLLYMYTITETVVDKFCGEFVVFE